MRVGVLQGQLKEFNLADVLQVASIGRQYLGVEVRRGAGLMGTIFVKAGKVVSVTTADAQGRDALYDLFQLNDGNFFVYRTNTPEPLPEPLGAVNGLLMELHEHDTGRTTPKTLPPAAAQLPPTSLESPVNALRPGRLPTLGEARTGGHVVAVASPKGGCGKTTVSLNLALSLARRGYSVVLVDADVNGDILSALDARERGDIGIYDVLFGAAELENAILATSLPGLKVVPATGALPPADKLLADLSDGWKRALTCLAADADVVLVDTPAGMLGVTNQVLTASSHVVGVLQAEVVASRSFSRFQQGLRALANGMQPNVLGVVINQLEMRHAASLSVFQAACGDLPSEWLFDTSVPRHRAFLDATQEGVPLRHMDEEAPPAIAFLFDNLAAEVADRLKLAPVQRSPRKLL